MDQFLADPYSRNAWVEEPGFRGLYVRKGARYINKVPYPRVIDIANVEANPKGQGTFTRLLTRLHDQGEILWVENVLNERLCPKLLRLGFNGIPDCIPPCFYLLASSPMLEEYKK